MGDTVQVAYFSSPCNSVSKALGSSHLHLGWPTAGTVRGLSTALCWWQVGSTETVAGYGTACSAEEGTGPESCAEGAASKLGTGSSTTWHRWESWTPLQRPGREPWMQLVLLQVHKTWLKHPAAGSAVKLRLPSPLLLKVLILNPAIRIPLCI